MVVYHEEFVNEKHHPDQEGQAERAQELVERKLDERKP